MARRTQPYHLKELQGTDFLYFKEHSQCLKNFDKDDNDEKVKWMEACLFQVRTDDQNALYLKYAFDKDFVRVDLVRCSRRSTPNSQLVLLYRGTL
ncbi:hypothetical protein LSAT2_007486, partial [Lamellibrachia satsuma]